jgi:hypothetical protein
MCDSLKDLISTVGKNNASGKGAQMKLKRDNKYQESLRVLIEVGKQNWFSQKKSLCVSFMIK